MSAGSFSGDPYAEETGKGRLVGKGRNGWFYQRTDGQGRRHDLLSEGVRTGPWQRSGGTKDCIAVVEVTVEEMDRS